MREGKQGWEVEGWAPIVMGWVAVKREGPVGKRAEGGEGWKGAVQGHLTLGRASGRAGRQRRVAAADGRYFYLSLVSVKLLRRSFPVPTCVKWCP